MEALRIEFLAKEIVNHFKKKRPGHCARVDFLTAVEAESLCRYIKLKQQKDSFAAYILARHDRSLDTTISITADRAIELRNRKQTKLCLFVPTDLVDAAYSSLANSFAVIDGRALHKNALKQVMKQLPAHAERFVHAVFTRLRSPLNVSDDQKLDFAIAVLLCAQRGEIERAGLELWRVNLVVDAAISGAMESAAPGDLEASLDLNRRCVLALARPPKIDATARERIQSLPVNGATARSLAAFFRGRSLNDVQSWSRALIERSELTFDRWVFPQRENSDIRSVNVASFVNAAGIVEKYCHLIQQDGANGSLIARCAPKEKLEVRWKSDPEQPKNLGGWRVAIVPVDSEIEYEGSIELPERDLPAGQRKAVISTDIEFDQPPDFPVCVRVMPLSSDGTVITDKNGEEIYGQSLEFFLSRDVSRPETSSRRESKFLVPNLASGRLAYLLESGDKGNALTETEPQWSCRDLDYFSIKLNERRLLQVGVSPLLLDLERQCLSDPRNSGCYILQVDDIHTVSREDFVPQQLSAAEGDSWVGFWKTRKLFFSRLREAAPRNVIEVADWTAELTSVALRYVQAYQDLLDDLLEGQADRQALREALSVDSILMRIAGRDNVKEEAVVILPTHPLRVAWLVNYVRLLQDWEAQLLKLASNERTYHLDLQALRQLTPINAPAFAFHIGTSTPFTFFQNLRFFHGVALPADVPDHHRRYGDVALLLGMTVDQGAAGDRHTEQLAEHLKNFRTLHPYVSTLVTTLINPDRGDFFAEAIKKTLPAQNADESEHEPLPMPTFQITAYTNSRHKSTLQAIEQIRQNRIDQQLYRQPTDHFLPALTTTSRSMAQFVKGKPPEAHIAVVTDLTRPEIRILAGEQQSVQSTTSSFAFYGLINRFISRFSADQPALRWQHAIVTEGVRKLEHRSSELLIKLHTALLRAGGYVLGGTPESQPVLEVTLNQEQRQVLERLHESTNWVVTLDRFFTLDYYDSPFEPGLRDLARKYILDYSPEFTDGLGHRMMVTTAWHEEIQSFLSQAMNELGFAHVDQSVSHLLHYLKTISGRLALQALESSTTAAAAVGLGVVTAWLQQKGRLKQAVLIPVDSYPRLFSLASSGKTPAGERRCDLVLISLRRNIVNATFIEVKWRRGQVPFEDLARDMALQMKGSASIMRSRFFNENRVDGALQRSYLANMLRFYFERSRRYQLFDQAAEQSFLEHVSRLEKSGLDFRPDYEGYIVSLDGEGRKPFLVDEARITVLTAKDFQSTVFLSQSFMPPEISTDVAYDEAGEADEPPGEDEVAGEDEGMMVEAADIDGKANVEAEKDSEESISRPEEDEMIGGPTQRLTAAQPAANGPVTVPLGRAAVANVTVDWQPSVDGSPHLFILGIPGQGKSWTVTRILTELGKQQVPALVLDFHGQFADPQEPFVQANDPLVLDAAKGLPFSPFECTQDAGSGGWLANSYAIAEIFAHVAGLGAMQRDIVFSAIRDAYRACGFNDDNDQSIEDLPLPTLTDVLQRIESLAQARYASNVVARCRPLLEMNLFRPPEQGSDLLSQIRSGLVIDLHNLYVETLQQAAGAFVLRKLYKDMFRWGYAKRIRLAVVLDEAHRLAKDLTLPKIMREGRKFGIAVIVASQTMADFHSDVLGTAGSKIIFRTNYPDSKKVAGFIRGLPGTDLAARIEQLPVGSAYVQTPEMSVGSVVKMYPLR
ncbi:MAG: ATP-binding protein [Ktedonobacteraceae bacterium]|nr:ATP-binding protein [Ktedonobacteraceae bacterium]